MIQFQGDKFQLDLTSYGVTLNEENDIFTDSINKNYSLPFTIMADTEILEKLGLPTLENIRNVDVVYPGNILLANGFLPAKLFLGEVWKNNIEANITFGAAELAIYATKIKDLPWPTQLAPNILTFAKSILNKSWPEVGFNFPMVYKPSIAKNSNYEGFKGFINNYSSGNFLANYVDESGEEDVYVNQNVMAPFPYLLEILRFGFKTAGKTLVGEVLQNEDLKKAVYIPQNYLERMDGSQYLAFSFDFRTSIDTVLGYNIYEQQLVPESVGVYDVSLKVNLDPVLADYFRLYIYRKDALSQQLRLVQLFQSEDNRVQLDEKIPVEVSPADALDPIVIIMKLRYTDRNISEFNNFEISFSNGLLNVFPTLFTLSDFVPEMTFGEYVNMLKNWWNIEIDIQERVAVASFLENSIFNKNIRNHEHLETPATKRTSNANRFYKLHYANDERIFFTKKGQIFSDLDDEGSDIIEINMNCQPAVVEMNKNILTAVAPEKESDLDFCVYDGIQNDRPTCPISLSRKLSLQQVFENWWKTWLIFRVNSYSYKDTFDCSPHEIIQKEELSRKYNELHIIKKLTRKFKNENVMTVDIESETF